MQSIIQTERTCYVCGSPYIQVHHVFFGPLRKLSDKYGCVAYLCQEHHTGNNGVHFNKALDAKLKKETQEAFEQIYADDFTATFGRNYK